MSTFLLVAPHLLVAVILHEIAHGLVAERLGDPTARMLGRITLNPVKHIDPFMTIILPGLFILSGSPVVFGGAKPVPVDTRNFRDPRRDMALVAVAGPITNLTIAGFWAYLFKGLGMFLPLEFLVPAVEFFLYGVVINLGLAVFNLIPFPPLDGGRIAVGVLPRRLADRLSSLERFGLFFVVALLYTDVLDKVLTPLIGWSIGFTLGGVLPPALMPPL